MIFDVRNISLAYGSGPTVVNNVSFSLDKGQTMTILGPNGAGKSTLLNGLINLHPPFEGEVLLCGKSVKQQSAREIARSVAYVRQHQPLSFAFEVLDFVVMGRAPRIGTLSRPKPLDYEKALAALESMGVANLAHRSYAAISGGQRQLVMIARAIAQEPQAILLDEPTAHLDFGNQIRTLELARKLSESGYAVVMTTHDPNHAILMEGQTAIIDQAGHFSVGHYSEMLIETRLEKLYQVELRVLEIREIARKACLNAKLKI